MRFSYYNKFDSVSRFYLAYKSLLIFVLDGQLVNYAWDGEKKWKAQAGTSHQLISLNEEVICAYTPFQKIVFLRLDSGEMIASKEIPFYPLMANNNNLHGTLLDANSKIFYTSYVDADFILNKGAFIGESVCIYLNNELTVTQKWNELFQYTSGIQKWARSASDMVTDVKDVKIEQVFFTSDIIVIRTSDNSLTGINIYDGKTIWSLRRDSNLFFTCAHGNEKIYAFSYGKYLEIDIASGQIQREQSFEQAFQKAGFSKVGHTAPVVNDNSIVIASSFEPIALVIDRITLNVEQVLALSGNYVPQTNTPVLSDGRLYVLDAQNTLHVFERSDG